MSHWVMTTTAIMIGASIAAWLLATVVWPAFTVEMLLGMMAPLVVTVTTMVLIKRTYERDPQELTPLMVKSFGAKMLAFGAYVALVLGATPVELTPIPFVASFTTSFIALHTTEAWWLKSLFSPVGTAGS